MSTAALIAVDWGTTNFRAYLLDRGGAVLDRVSAKRGIMNVAGGDFAAAYLEMVGAWQTSEARVPALMAGMIGSRNGWVEAAYVDCPADPAQLAKGLGKVPMAEDRAVWIVPGIACRNNGVYDVIRGEETQITGAVALTGCAEATFCMPGTHSKWVTVHDHAIAGFQTAMTGELFSVLRDHSILGRLMVPGADAPPSPAFETGLDRAGDAGGLLHHLFGVRAEALFETIGEADTADYLSGILIGHEIHGLGTRGPVMLIGTDALNQRYRRALERYGYRVDSVPGEDAVIAGLWSVARQAGIVENDR